MKRARTLAAVFSIFAALGAAPAFAEGGHEEPPAGHAKCNSGRGNLSEASGNLQNGGPGQFPTATTDCDPGNSGAKNRGGD